MDTKASSTDSRTASPIRDDAPHTPGPWMIGGGERGKYRVFALRPEATIVASTANNARDRTRQAAANARRIAAVPEMYAVLKRFIDAETSWREMHGAPDDPLTEAFELAVAAIAKAEGR